MDPITLAALLNAVPARFVLPVALFVIACKAVTVFVRPPPATSKWAKPFQIVSMIALNVGWAANRLQVGKTGIMVARDQAEDAKSVLASTEPPIRPLPGKVPPSAG